jgi:anaerobic selenocysteine-containing dehydrogenase
MDKREFVPTVCPYCGCGCGMYGLVPKKVYPIRLAEDKTK